MQAKAPPNETQVLKPVTLEIIKYNSKAPLVQSREFVSMCKTYAKQHASPYM
jgi:hypothetical protein